MKLSSVTGLNLRGNTQQTKLSTPARFFNSRTAASLAHRIAPRGTHSTLRALFKPAMSTPLPSSSPSPSPSTRLVSTKAIEGNSSAIEGTPFNFGQAMPKEEIQALALMQRHPSYDGRGTVIAIFDSGVDPAAVGLQVTSEGKPKVVDLVDCTGSGDVDMSTVVRLGEDGFLTSPLTGTRMRPAPGWSNPSGEWRVGFKRIYELYSAALKGKVKEARARAWDEAQRRALARAQTEAAAHLREHPAASQSEAQRKHQAELDARVKLLGDLQAGREDLGPLVDCVVWRDGEGVLRAALDTRQLHWSPTDPKAEEAGFLERFARPLTNFRAERQYGTFSPQDALNFAVNLYEEGRVLSLVTDCSPHGTHVAGIAAACHPEAPEMNGVAPGAQIISCKIGDHRVGSMETGPGLTRAVKAVLDNKADLVNMSYGEMCHVPNRGRFIELVEELVYKHNVVYLASAGNAGPSSSTLSSPGGTSSAIIGVGAYVTPELAAAGHSVCGEVDGQQYTWSSRGPTADGHTGVCISAPGGAVAPVPQWTSSKRQLMNGTSMSSPNACGGLSVLISALKQEGLAVTPARIRRAIENTALPLSPAGPADATPGPWVLTSGRGLLQVADALEFLRKSEDCDKPDHRYELKVYRVDQDAASATRGVYLREPAACDRVTEHVVSVNMAQTAEADVREEQWPLEARIALECPAPWVNVPPLLFLHKDGRVFRARVDPKGLEPGRLHYTEVLAFDSERRWRGPLFRVPITVCKPLKPSAQTPYLASLGRLEFNPGEEVRRFLEVPQGATHAKIKVACSETPEHLPLSYYIRTAYLDPQVRTSVTEFRQYQTLPEFSETEGSFAVKSGATLEVTLAAFWSLRGRGAVTADIEFFGLEPLGPSGGSLVLNPTSPSAVLLRAALRSQKLQAKASLSAVQFVVRPSEALIEPCRDPRDQLPGGRTTSALTLTYKVPVTEAGKFAIKMPAVAGTLYDGLLDTSVFHVYNPDRRLVGFVDCYAPDSLSLKKGEHVLRTVLRHEDVSLLERYRDQALVVERTLDSPVSLPVYASLQDALKGGKQLDGRPALLPGDQVRVTVGPVPEDKLPADAKEGRVMVGKVSYSQAGLPSYPITYVVPPPKAKNGNGFFFRAAAADKASEEPAPTPEEKLRVALRDASLAHLKALKLDSEAARQLHASTLDELLARDPGHLPILLERLKRAQEDAEAAPRTSEAERSEAEARLRSVLARASEVVAAVDQVALAQAVARKCDEEGPGAAQRRKRRDEDKAALIEAYDKRCRALVELDRLSSLAPAPLTVPSLLEPAAAKTPLEAIDEAWGELRKWTDPASDSTFAMLQARIHERAGRLAQAVQALAKVADADTNGNGSSASAKEAIALRLELLERLGWDHWRTHEKLRTFERFPTSAGYPSQLS